MFIYHLILQVNHVTKKDLIFKGQKLRAESLYQEYTQHLPPKSLHLTGTSFLFFLGGEGKGAGCSDTVRTDLSRRLDIQIFLKKSNPSKHTYC